LDVSRLQALQQRFPAVAQADVDAVKEALKRNTDEAIARGVFGVPSLAVDDKLFWGFDGLPMLRGYLDGDPWFDGPAWHGVGGVPVGVTRRK
jgi:2-hydroxychromene-2-carboxylate isomerase